jgi:hypothetical protein
MGETSRYGGGQIQPVDSQVPEGGIAEFGKVERTRFGPSGTIGPKKAENFLARYRELSRLHKMFDVTAAGGTKRRAWSVQAVVWSRSQIRRPGVKRYFTF